MEFHPLLWIIRHTYSIWYIKHHRVRTVGFDKKQFKKGPFLLISNHCGTYDPIIISSLMPRTVRWVTGAYLFKSKFLNYIFARVCRCIAKQQGQSDFSTVRDMQKNLKEGNVVGVFPEGTRTWDGNMMPYSKKALAKLIKIFGVPTVFINLDGCFAQQPRWADSHRHGQGISVNFRKVFTKEEVKESSVIQIEQYLADCFDFSNDVWKTTDEYKFISDTRAEGLQKFLYMCPNCRSVGFLATEGNKIKCTKCGADARITEKDDISSDSIPFRHFSEWHDWEKEQIKSLDSLQEEKAVLFQTGKYDNSDRLKTISEDIRVCAEGNTLFVKCVGGNEYDFDCNRMSSFIINAKQTMEFIIDDTVYRLRLMPDSSALKIQEYCLSHKDAETSED